MIRIEKLEKKRYKAVKVMEWFKMQSLKEIRRISQRKTY